MHWPNILNNHEIQCELLSKLKYSAIITEYSVPIIAYSGVYENAHTEIQQFWFSLFLLTWPVMIGCSQQILVPWNCAYVAHDNW